MNFKLYNDDGTLNIGLLAIIGVVLMLIVAAGKTADVAPIKETGLRVLVVEKANGRSEMLEEQIQILYSTKVREYLDTHCVKYKGLPEYRFFADTDDLTNETKVWQDAMKIERKSLPWVIISNPPKGTSVPLPKDEASMLQLLKQYGG